MRGGDVTAAEAGSPRSPDLYDLSDDSDYAAAASDQTIELIPVCCWKAMRTDPADRASEETARVDVVYEKERVTIHPSQYGSSRISGKLRLFLQQGSLFLSWEPNEGAGSLSTSSVGVEVEKYRNLYTIKALPLSDVRFIRKYTPTFGLDYVIIVLSSGEIKLERGTVFFYFYLLTFAGLAFPPFYFYNGGIRELFATLKQHVFIIRSDDDPNVFLVNDFQDPLQKSLSSLELPGVASVANAMSRQNSLSFTGSIDESRHGDNVRHGATSSMSQYSSKQNHKSNDPGRDLSIQVLEKFSLVTKFARDTTSSLFRDNSGAHAYGRQQHQYILDNKSTNKHKNQYVTPEKASAPSATLESDPLPLVWGKQRDHPLSVEEWTSFLDREGRIMDSKALRKKVFYGGVDHALRKEVWKFLLGYHEYDSTYAEREYLAVMKRAEYEVIKSQWKSISATQAKRFTKFRERKGLIDKDVVRTDRSIPYYEGDDNQNVVVLRDILLTYSFYNFDLGYCQGMSDFLAPILYVMEDESESFWCFASLMERLGANFNRDQNGMHAQLLALSKLVELLDPSLHNYFRQNDCLNYFFCFRWVLIQFKREFSFDQIMLLWEVLWSHYLSEHFHLYLCVAILKKYRQRIIGEQMDFDTLLKFINELSGQINLDRAIQDAEALCTIAGENGASCIPPGTPPSMPVETDGGMYVQEDEVL
ncbi:RabGAP/TBC domain-containing protein [Zea mays]|uniref:TBC1 domain family member 15 n=4 Tax=Zea mays TaxID=4577 RepID=A0A1D6Q878_MAIZE|nr:RabGAP/TBC domain-containing protein [Zea mays]